MASPSEPWILRISATAGSSAGFVRITFNDADFVAFPIPANQSFSLTQTLGGVPGVDDLVKVEITGGSGGVAMVSALARPDTDDPFSGDSERDNYCLTGQSASTGDAGVVSANSQIPY